MPAVLIRRRRLQMVCADAVVTAAAGTAPAAAGNRTLRGLALPYGDAGGRTSAGLIRASAGAVRWSTDLRRIKVFSGHDRNRPVGYVTALTEDAGGLRAELHIAATPDGDQALLEAREGTRDALSVELEDVEVDDNGELVGGELVALALVPLPAFTDARIAAERGDPDDTDDGDQDDNTDAGGDTDDNQGGPDVPGTNPPSIRAARAPAALQATRRRSQSLTLHAAAAQLADAFVTGDRSAAALNAALADITPVTTGSAALAPPQWLGELWTPELVRLDWANAVQSDVLTSMKLTGWKRLPPGPVISPYGGNKAQIPTDATLGFGPVTVDAHRHAVGADFDRIWVDFGDETVITTWLRLVAQDYAKKLDKAMGDLIIGEATDGGDAANVLAAVSVAAQALQAAGAVVNWIGIAADLYADYLSITSADAPWWLAQSSSVDLAGQSASVNNLRVFTNPSIPAGTVLAGDRRAATQYTPRGNPFTVRAVDLARGGIDAAVFGYSAELINDPLGIVSVGITPVGP